MKCVSLLFYDHQGEELEEVQFHEDDPLYPSVRASLSDKLGEEMFVNLFRNYVSSSVEHAVEIILDEAGVAFFEAEVVAISTLEVEVQ